METVFRMSHNPCRYRFQSAITADRAKIMGVCCMLDLPKTVHMYVCMYPQKIGPLYLYALFYIEDT